jgi:hypothetical protein
MEQYYESLIPEDEEYFELVEKDLDKFLHKHRRTGQQVNAHD